MAGCEGAMMEGPRLLPVMDPCFGAVAVGGRSSARR